MLLLVRRNVRQRPARTLFTALAIALGVAMIFAMRIVSGAISASAQAARESRLAGADLEITTLVGGHFSVDSQAALAGLPEVERVAPLLRVLEGEPDAAAIAEGLNSQALRGTGLTLLGLDPANLLTTYRLAQGDFLSAAGAEEVVLPAAWAALRGLGVGDKLELVSGPGRRSYTITGLLEHDPSAAGPPAALLPLHTLQAALGEPGQVSSLLVRLRPGMARAPAQQAVQAAAGSQFAVISANGASGVSSLASLTNLALPLAGAVSLLSGAFLVFNAFAITLVERQREIGQLRAIGVTRGQVLALTLLEAGLTALVGCGLGLALGWGLGAGVAAAINSLQNTPGIRIDFPLDGALLACTAGLGVTLVVISGLAWRSSRIAPLAALQLNAEDRPGNTTRRWWPEAAGVILLLLTALLAWNALRGLETLLQPDWGPIFLPQVSIFAAALCFLPLAVRLVVGMVVHPRLAGQGRLLTLRLAGGSMQRQPARAARAAASFAISLGIVIALAAMANFFQAFLQQSTSFVAGDAAFRRQMPPGLSFDQLAALPSFPPPSPELLAGLAELRDVAEVIELANVSLPGIGVETGMGDQYAFALSFARLSTSSLFSLSEGSWEEAARYFSAGPAIQLPELTARRLNKHPGDSIEIDTLRGRVTFIVAAVGGGFPVLMPEVGAEYFSSYPAFYMLEAHPGVAPQEVESLARDLVNRYPAELGWVDAASFKTIVSDITDPIVGLFSGLTSLSAVIAALGISVTLAASILERQRELGTLRALGMARSSVRWLVALESGLIGLVGSLVGVAGGMGIAFLFSLLTVATMKQIGGYFGDALPPLPWAVALAGLVSGPLVSVLVSLIPAGRAADVNPAEAMRAEGASGFLPPAAHLGPRGLRGMLARLPLAVRISIGSSLIFVLTVAALTAIRVEQERRLLVENTQLIIGRQMDVTYLFSLSQYGVPDIESLDDNAISELFGTSQTQFSAVQAALAGIENMEGGSDLRYVWLTDESNTVIFSKDPGDIGRRMPLAGASPSGSATQVELVKWQGESIFEARVPILNQNGRRLGLARLGISSRNVDGLVADIWRGSLWTMAVALLVSIALTTYFTRRSLAPLAQVAYAAHKIALGDLSQSVPETHWDEMGQLQRAFNDMAHGLREREQLRDLFGRFVSPEVQQAVLAGRISLIGERRRISVLYCDLRDSTRFAEERPPEVVMQALNQYFAVIIAAIQAEGGIVNRFVGDEAVCIFNAPVERPDHAARALRSALAIRRGLADLNDRRALQGEPLLHYGIGIHSGEVVAGATGSEERQEYTVIGDTMNTGARLQALCKDFPGEDILLSAATLAAAPAGSFACTLLGEFSLRGKQTPVQIYALKEAV